MRRLGWQLAMFSAFFFYSHSAQAAIFDCKDVTCLSFSIAMANANGQANTIILRPGLYIPTSVNHTAQNRDYGLPAIQGTITIRGGDAGKTLISSTSLGLFDVASTGNLTLDRVVLTGSVRGGVIHNANGGNASIVHSLITKSGTYSIFNDGGTLTIDASTISDNSGDICVFLTTGGVVRISDSTFIHNLGGHECGVMDIAGGSAFITRSTFRKNAADGAGAIIARKGTVTTITNSLFTENTSTGMPIYNVGVMFVTNTTITRNVQGPEFLGVLGASTGIGDVGGSMLIDNSTIVDNSTTGPGPSVGGAVWSDTTNTLIQNSIVARNKLGNCLGPIRSLGNNIFDDTSCSAQPTDFIGDPGLGAFLDDETPGHGHYPLLFFSRAINGGNDAVCPAEDQISHKRQGQCDIGAIAGPDFDHNRF